MRTVLAERSRSKESLGRLKIYDEVLGTNKMGWELVPKDRYSTMRVLEKDTVCEFRRATECL